MKKIVEDENNLGYFFVEEPEGQDILDIISPSETSKVLCSEHGISYTIIFKIDNQEIGKYCFECYNDFLGKHLKNYSKEY